MNKIIEDWVHALNGLKSHRDEIDTVIIDMTRALEGMKRLGIALSQDIPTPVPSTEKKQLPAPKAKRKKPSVEVQDDSVPPVIYEWIDLPRAAKFQRRSATIKDLAKKYDISVTWLNRLIRKHAHKGSRLTWRKNRTNDRGTVSNTSE